MKKFRPDDGWARAAAVVFLAVFTAGVVVGRLQAQESDGRPLPKVHPVSRSRPLPPLEESHRFWDKTNLMLFTGVAAVRALDFTSTQHFRHNGHNEVLLTNGIVDNKPLFAGIEVAGTALSIGVAYWLHRTGHHKLERWVSVVHIGVAAVGDIHNYTLGPVR